VGESAADGGGVRTKSRKKSRSERRSESRPRFLSERKTPEQVSDISDVKDRERRDKETSSPGIERNEKSRG